MPFSDGKSNAIVKGALKSLGMESYQKIFAEHGIVDDDLLFLQEKDIAQMVKKVGPRVRFWAWLQLWQAQQTNLRQVVVNGLRFM